MIDDKLVSDFWEFTPIKQSIIESVENLKLKKIHIGKKLLIFAGSGMSQESGIPVFHGSDLKGGLSQKDGIELVNNHTPHQGYIDLLNFCEGKEYYVMTSNIDGYFAKAGFDPQRVVEVHGNVNYMQCPNGCAQIFNYKEGSRCEECYEYLVSNVMVSGFHNFISKTSFVEKNMDIDISTDIWTIIEIGAGVLVPVIRDYSEILVEDKKFNLIRINPEHWQIPENILSKNTSRIPHKSILGIKILLDYIT